MERTIMVYIQFKYKGEIETIDSFSTYKEAKTMLAEYRLSFSEGYLYLSKRATKAWREASQRDSLKNKGVL